MLETWPLYSRRGLQLVTRYTETAGVHQSQWILTTHQFHQLICKSWTYYIVDYHMIDMFLCHEVA